MAVSSIWAPRQESNRPANDIVGTFRSGMVKRRLPVALEFWRVTCDDPDVAETIEQLFGGETSENDSDRESLQVMTAAKSVGIDMISIDSGFCVWANGKLVRTCNGAVQLSGDEAGQPCVCAGLDLDARKEASKGGGCKPDVRVVFTLADAPNLGIFQFRSGAWSLLESIQPVEAKVDAAREDGNTVPGRLAIEKVKNKAGTKEFTLPRVTVKR